MKTLKTEAKPPAKPEKPKSAMDLWLDRKAKTTNSFTPSQVLLQ